MPHDGKAGAIRKRFSANAPPAALRFLLFIGSVS